MSKPIEFKAGTLTAMTAVVRDLDNVQLAHTLHTMLGGMGEFFAGEATVIDLTQLTNIPKRVDWSGLASLLRRYGLQPVAVKGAPEELEDGAKKVGFAVLSQVAGKTSGDKAVALEQKKKEQEATAAQAELPMETAAAPTTEAAASAAASTMIIDRSVRSGQQIYARGADLVILGGVSNGAEVIADGSIHCYGPLRGRALAGAQGNVAARLWCTNFGPELISIAGVYRTFERGIAENLAGKPVHAMLRAATGKSAEEKHALSIEPLQLD